MISNERMESSWQVLDEQDETKERESESCLT